MERKTNTISGIFDRIDRILGEAMRWFCIAGMVLLAVVLSGVVLVRFVPVAKLSWSDELIEWTFAWMVFIGSAALWRLKEHFFVDTLSGFLRGRRAGFYHQMLVEVLSAVFFIMFTYYSYRLTAGANDRSPILEWPRPLWYGCMPVAGFLMSVYSLRTIFGALAGRTLSRKKTRDQAGIGLGGRSLKSKI